MGKKETTRVRRTFTPQFKRDAVKLVNEGKTVSEVARDLGIARSLLQRWRDRARERAPLRGGRFALAERSSAANRRPPRWRGDAGVDFIEVFRLNRSYRVASVNKWGKRGLDGKSPARASTSRSPRCRAFREPESSSPPWGKTNRICW